ncbi:hypothetical protein LPJ78_003866 [Coemansia sp. RSA 989]|nr:hypothetical protein LPJ78_003866 [Coemansia sp. RSA 989]
MLNGLSDPVFYCTNNDYGARSDNGYDTSRVFNPESELEELFASGNDPKLVVGEKIFVEFDDGTKYIASDNVKLFQFLECVGRNDPIEIKGEDVDDNKPLKEFKDDTNTVHVTVKKE